VGLERLFYKRELVVSEKGSSRGEVTTQSMGAGGCEERDQRREVGTLPESRAEHLDLEQGIRQLCWGWSEKLQIASDFEVEEANFVGCFPSRDASSIFQCKTLIE